MPVKHRFDQRLQLPLFEAKNSIVLGINGDDAKFAESRFGPDSSASWAAGVVAFEYISQMRNECMDYLPKVKNGHMNTGKCS